MQDRYKFRGYNKNLKKWFYGGYITQAEYTDSPFERPGMKSAPVNHFIVFEEPGDWGLPTKLKLALVDKESVGQCTGIKDVKGKLIYEGDILKVVNGSINCSPLESNKVVKRLEKHDSWNIEQWIFDNTHSYEVIGNIYKNPEMINGK